LAVQRPQQFALVLTKGVGISVINGDKQLYEYLGPKELYVVHDAPKATVAEASQTQLVQYSNFGQGLGPVGSALSAASLDDFLANYESLAFIGHEEKDDAKTQHLRIVQKGMPIDLWLSGDSTRLLSFAPDLRTGLAKQGQELPAGIDFSVVVAFKNWSYDAPPSADAFAIEPPKDAQQVDDLFAQPPHPLLGKQAPAFESVALDGKAIKPSDLAGKVVVLDFWATWCGPCVKALPAISATAAKYKDKGVLFYAVNQGEEAPIVQEFLTSQKLNVPVALDLEGKVGTQFGVEGIPQTVIIDKTGKIQVIHVGAGDDIGAQLAKELDAVLAGQDLADAKLKKKKE
jgi:thiol-disulfide isomerase/thioredoxin